MSVVFDFGGGSVELPNPIYGSTRTLNVLRALNSSKNNQFAFREDSWPKYESFNVQFATLPWDKIIETLTLFNTYWGQEVTIIDDFLGITYVGLITSRPDYTEEGRGCQFTLSFTYEGVVR